ncbi:unnamed protein product [Phaedon cochleariae]|uniref:ENT domain-containing protein n=1 Tax=Phaedon cochleariae TaxID=80249 RepID=A0A9N9X0H4_PHACE|nr:unnamed protein product [Phaedon cochleariae]
MWPLLLDMTKDESIQNLRNLELEAYSHLVSALRAQGSLSLDKRKLLKETGCLLNITQERHKAEVRRAISDEKLNTIAYHITGQSESVDEWAQEGRRLVPLLPRTPPQTLYSSVADDVGESASQSNRQLPLPSNTERHKPSVIQIPIITAAETASKSVPFRIPDPPKGEENTKKRKLAGSSENSSLAQQLLTPKLCRIQQLYRQRTKQKQKELHKKTDQSDHIEMVHQHRAMQHIPQQSMVIPTSQNQFINQKVNILQNVSLQPIKEESVDQEDIDRINMKIPDTVSGPPVFCNENHAPSQRPKIVTSIKPNAAENPIMRQSSPQPAGSSNEVPKAIRVCPGKKPITKTVNSQKLIVVSNAQSIPTSSILQRTLQIPFVKNVSIKNLEKFKIVPSISSPTPMHLNNVNSGLNNVKHKMVTVKTNPNSKKVIPLSQLQVLNSKGSIKVLPLGGKIVGKSVTETASPLFIMNTSQQPTKSTSSSLMTSSKIQNGEEAKVQVLENESCDLNRENGKSTVLGDILKAAGVISGDSVPEDYDTKIEEFHIPQIMNRSTENVHSEVFEMNKDEEQNGDVSTIFEMETLKEEEHIIEHDEVQIDTNIIANDVIESENPSTDMEEFTAINDELSTEVPVLFEMEYLNANDNNGFT